MEQFYVTLLSNSSTDIFPKNHTSSFTVRFQNKITLSENWFVGLVEIHYRYNFFNVTSENNTLIELQHFENRRILLNEQSAEIQIYKEKGKYREVKIDPGVYASIKELIFEINKRYQTTLFKHIPSTNRVQINEESEYFRNVDAIFLQGKLAPQLGFRPNQNILVHDKSPDPSSLHFGTPEQMMVYVDIIEPQIIGHEQAQVIKTVRVGCETSKEFGAECYHEFQNIHYVPVLKKEFETIEVNIRDYAGAHLPFCHGVLSMKLHFIKKINNGRN